MQKVKPILTLNCENETSTNNILDMETNQSKRGKNIDVIITNK